MDNFPLFFDQDDADHPDDAEKGIFFDAEDVDFALASPERISAWIQLVLQQQQATLVTVQYVFCSDDYLHQMNVDFLQHDTLTDIITFPYAPPPLVSGDIFISIDRVRDNAADLQHPFFDELHRVIIHGVLHLCGLPDKTPAEAQRMRQAEDEALALLATLA